jgi:hypothetical protein
VNMSLPPLYSSLQGAHMHTQHTAGAARRVCPRHRPRATTLTITKQQRQRRLVRQHAAQQRHGRGAERVHGAVGGQGAPRIPRHRLLQLGEAGARLGAHASPQLRGETRGDGRGGCGGGGGGGARRMRGRLPSLTSLPNRRLHQPLCSPGHLA